MARRMSNGDGTRPKYDENKKLWRIDLTIPDGDTTKRRTLYGKSEEEVKVKRDNLKDEIKNGCLVSSDVDKLTLGVWLTEWLEVYKKRTLANNTYTLYDCCIRLWISESLKKVKLKMVRHNTLQKMINESDSTNCKIIRTVLHQSLKMAVKNKYILNNPANDLIMPQSNKKKVIPLTDKEVSELLADRKNKKSYLYYVLSVYTGARIGEVLGLSWDDIDLKNNVIHIRHSLKYNRINHKHEIGSTKTGKERDVPILPSIISVIKQHKARQSAEKIKLGTGYNTNNMVFCNAVGEYLQMGTVYSELKRIVKKLKIGTNTTPHTLRHTFVSQMISAGNTSITLISNIVGHANISITLNTYSHLMPNDMQEAFTALEKHMKHIAI